MVDSILSASATVSPIKGSVRAARNAKSATPRFIKEWPRSWIREYHRRHYPNEPKRRCSIHNRPTCPFSADDGTLTEHRKGPRPVVYKINLRFRRFSCGTGQITGLIVYYIAPRPKDARRGSSVSRAHDLARFGSKPGPAAISPCTITMDHDAIICFMTDGLTRGPALSPK